MRRSTNKLVSKITVQPCVTQPREINTGGREEIATWGYEEWKYDLLDISWDGILDSVAGGLLCRACWE